jgi:hypothetical protein
LRGEFTDAVMMRDYGTLDFLSAKFASKPEIRDANITAFKAGYAFGETTEVCRRGSTVRSRAILHWRTG